MSWQAEIDDIARRKSFAMEQGGSEAVARQHADGRLTARERIDKILDPGSWREIGALTGKATYDGDGKLLTVRPANAIIGTGRIDGRKVSIAADDYTIRGGSSEATVSEK